MKLSFVSLELHNFKGIVGDLIWKFHEQPGFYFVQGENKKEPRLGGNGVGKALSDDLIIDTPTGKVRWGDLKVGDFVFGSDGKPTEILGKYPQGEKLLYRVEFDDGTNTLCCEDHLWEVHSSNKKWYGTHILPTRDLIEIGLTYNNGSAKGAKLWRLPKYVPVEFNNPHNLHLDPYVLGAWLGNGGKEGHRITVNKNDVDIINRLISVECRRNVREQIEEVKNSGNFSLEELADELNKRGILTPRNMLWNGANVWAFLNKSTEYYSKEGFSTTPSRGAVNVRLSGLNRHLDYLGLLGLGSSDRFIPALYLTASIGNRLTLLQGLMDSDGYCGINGAYSFSTTSTQLVEDISWLVRSLGGKVSKIREKETFYKYKERKIICLPCYTVGFSLPNGMPPFFSQRKSSRVKESHQERYLERWITSITPEDVGSCSCITVAAKNGLFLANDFIVTHNSTLFVDAPYWILTGKTILSQRPGALVENWDDNKGTKGILHIKLDDEDYVIERGRNPSILTLNGSVVQQPEIDKLLPLSDAALRRTLLLGQRSSLFLDLRPEDKSRLFSETLDLARWLLASDRAGEQVKNLERDLLLGRADLAGSKSRAALFRDQHDAAITKEAAFAADRVSRLNAIDRELSTRMVEQDGVRDTLREARSALASLTAPGTSGDRTPLSRLAQARQDEGIKRRNLGAIEANLRNIRIKEQEAKDKLETYQIDGVCPECGQTVTIQHIEEQRTDLSQRISAAMELGDAYAAEANALDRELMGIAMTIRDLEKETKQVGEISHEIQILEIKELSITRSLETMVKERDKIAAEKNPFTVICDDLETQYDKEKKQIVELEDRYKEIESRIEIYKFWQKGFRDIRLELIDATLLELELTTNRNAQALGLEDWRIEFSTERETKAGALSQAFTVLLYPPGQQEPIDWAAYSGGESQRWHIAVTCGLSEVLLNRAGIEPDTEIYDEITTYISHEGIEDVLEFLKQRSIELNRKIYLIDHHVGVGDFTDTVSLVKDEAGIRIQQTA